MRQVVYEVGRRVSNGCQFLRRPTLRYASANLPHSASQPVLDITIWVYLIIGSLVALTGLSLIVGRAAARVVGVFFVAVNAIAQIV